MKSVANLSSEQAYCLDQMGVTRWQSLANTQAFQLYRPNNPWHIAFTDQEEDPAAAEALTEVSSPLAGFSQPSPKPKLDAGAKDKTVAGLKQELVTESGVIVEDLQPIEDLSVAIEPAPSLPQGLPKTLHCMSLLIDNRMLILSDVPRAFHDQAEVERLAVKMAQALLKQELTEWQTGYFDWPGPLKNPLFLDRSDWMLGALEGYIASRLPASENNDPQAMLVLAGNQIQQVVSEIEQLPQLKAYRQARIVSLPELYRIPELKVDAWKTLQGLLR